MKKITEIPNLYYGQLTFSFALAGIKLLDSNMSALALVYRVFHSFSFTLPNFSAYLFTVNVLQYFPSLNFVHDLKPFVYNFIDSESRIAV